MTTYESRRISPGGDLTDAFEIRRDVFMDEQGVSAAEEFDGKDENAVHYVVYVDGSPAGTARLREPDEGVAKIERVAVRKAHRGNGIGNEVMDLLESEALAQGCERVVLHAQTAVEEFYEKRGYETRSGVFEEDGILHVRMTKDLE